MVNRLSGMDAFFLSMEGTAWPQHTAGLMILDPSAAPGFNYHAVRNHLQSRLPYLPQLGRRIQEVPLQLDRPVWVDDPRFNLDAHVHHIAVPSPGGERELAAVVGEILARPLNRNQPLWECWYVEGLESGRVAFIAKTHHAMVDGVSGAGLSAVLCDPEPEPAEPLAELPDEQRQRPRWGIELLARGALSSVRSAPKFVQFARQTVGGAVTTISHQRRSDPPPRPMSAPRTTFNGVISPRREFAYCSMALKDVKWVKDHFGVKVNDVILNVVAGALRAYLVQRGELPERPILATVPMSTRSPQDIELGNLVHPMVASLATDIEDPVARLTAIHRGMNSAKELAEELTKNQSVGLTDIAPPFLMNLVFRAYQAAKLEQRLPLNTNLIMSNVPGPPSQLYLAGARIEHIFPVGPLNFGMGINVTVMSYRDLVDVGVQVDPALVEDPWELTAAAAEELDRLVAATR
jgi:diacylglycerol O-acyltransferase / wax synthase